MKTSPRTRTFSPATLGVAIAAALAFSASAQADAIVSKDLQSRLGTAPTHQVIVTFKDRSDMPRLAALAAKIRPLKDLPMAGAVLTTAQVNLVASWDRVESI